MDIVSGIIIGALILYALIKDFIHYRAVADLTKKIMAKDLTDYSVVTETKNPNQEDKPDENLVDLVEEEPQSLDEVEEDE